MSEQEKIALYTRLSEVMKRGTLKMLERKAKLGEKVVISDSNGNPIEIPASEALQLYKMTINE